MTERASDSTSDPDAMVRAEPHRSVMKRQHAAMAEGVFRFWTAPSAPTPER